MLTKELDFDVPAELIAQEPVEPRDAARLLVFTPPNQVVHTVFRKLTQFLTPGDVLVINNSRVLPARVEAEKTTGGRLELLFLRQWETDAAFWEILARPSRRLRPGLVVDVGGFPVEIERRLGEGRWLVRRADGGSVLSMLETVGDVPLPPYIRRRPPSPEDYQTVYARTPGSAAAPTAGLHFTRELLQAIEAQGGKIVPVTLHIGLDTFRPITETRVENHKIHTEYFSVTSTAHQRLAKARAEGRRIIAVGTTAVRVLESIFSTDDLPCWHSNGDGSITGSTSLFISSGYRFRAVDGLITNFHLPRTSLMALVMAFAGVEAVRNVYDLALQQRYRFYSFGDAMFITRRGSPGDAPGEPRAAGAANE